MEKKQPLLSVLMTAYNRGKYITEAIESVLASTYENFELIIVDDCSTDNTLEIARQYLTKDIRVKVYENAVNQGQFNNRNIAASYASGEYIKYLDSDDTMYPFTLQLMIEGMLKFPEAGLGFCLTHGPCLKPLPYVINSEDALRQHFFGGGLLFCGPSGLIIKRMAFEAVGGFEEFGMPSDNHLTLKIASQSPVVAMIRDLFWWRIHPGQVFSQNEGNHLNILFNYRYTADIIRNYSVLTKEENRTILRTQRRIFYMNISRLALKKKNPLKALELMFSLKEMSKKVIAAK